MPMPHSRIEELTDIILHRTISKFSWNHLQQLSSYPALLRHRGIWIPIGRNFLEAIDLYRFEKLLIYHKCRTEEAENIMPQLLVGRCRNYCYMSPSCSCQMPEPCSCYGHTEVRCSILFLSARYNEIQIALRQDILCDIVGENKPLQANLESVILTDQNAARESRRKSEMLLLSNWPQRGIRGIISRWTRMNNWTVNILLSYGLNEFNRQRKYAIFLLKCTLWIQTFGE